VAGGFLRRLDPGVTFGLFPLLLTRSPLLLDAPPKAIKAPSSAALVVVSLLSAVEGTRDGPGDLCARDIAAGSYSRDWDRLLASYFRGRRSEVVLGSGVQAKSQGTRLGVFANVSRFDADTGAGITLPGGFIVDVHTRASRLSALSPDYKTLTCEATMIWT